MNAKIITISLQSQDYILERIPSSFSELLKAVQSIFADQLPAHWALQYTDNDNDRIMLTTENDFEVAIKELENFDDALQLTVIPINKDLSFIENQDFSSGISGDSEIDLDESFNVIEKEDEPKKAKDLTELDFSGIITVEDPNEKELSMLNVESPEIPKHSTSAIEVSTSPLFVDDQNKGFLEGKSVSLIVEHACQIEEEPPKTPSILIERGSQTYYSPPKIDLTQDKMIQTQARMLERIEDTSYKKPETQTQTAENEERLLRDITNMSDQTSRTVLDHSEEKFDSKSKKVIKIVHSQCYCDGCGMCPLVGVRYRCSVCEDFDFCERCEATKEHPHLFLRIKNPKEYSKLKHSVRGKSFTEENENDFSFKDLGRRFKETTFAKVMSNTYGQLPEQAMHTLNKLFRSIKTNLTKVYDDSSSDEEESPSDYDETSRYDVLPNRGKKSK